MDLSETWNFARGKQAPQPLYVAPTKGPQTYGPNPVGYYSGVSVRGNQVPPNPPPKLGTQPASMTWAGFERTTDGSRVFFQLSAQVAHSLQQQGRVITLRIRNTRITGRNNTRHLDLRFFRTPVETVRMRRQGSDTVVTITLKQSATPTVELVDADGSAYKLLLVEFPDEAAVASGVDPR